jgi:2,3-bisphosphoglycerate-independent phosphoglycerate mutase
MALGAGPGAGHALVCRKVRPEGNHDQRRGPAQRHRQVRRAGGIDVPGATGTIDTNYEGKVQATLEALKSCDFVYLHIEAPDEAGHEGDTSLEVRAIELFDEKVVGPVVEGLQKRGQDWRVLLLPDHATPISIKTHSRDPVPFAIMGTGIVPDVVERFDEQAAKQGGYVWVEATGLIRLLSVS